MNVLSFKSFNRTFKFKFTRGLIFRISDLIAVSTRAWPCTHFTSIGTRFTRRLISVQIETMIALDATMVTWEFDIWEGTLHDTVVFLSFPNDAVSSMVALDTFFVLIEGSTGFTNTFTGSIDPESSSTLSTFH